MKNFELKNFTSLGLALCFIAVLSGCAKEVEMGELPVESNDISIGDALTIGNIGENDIISAAIENGDCIYDESGLFSKPLSKYEFKYFPKVNRTEVDLNSVLDAYGMSYEDFTGKFVRIIYTSGGAYSYEEAYGLTTLALNRLICCYPN